MLGAHRPPGENAHTRSSSRLSGEAGRELARTISLRSRLSVAACARAARNQGAWWLDNVGRYRATRAGRTSTLGLRRGRVCSPQSHTLHIVELVPAGTELSPKRFEGQGRGTAKPSAQKVSSFLGRMLPMLESWSVGSASRVLSSARSAAMALTADGVGRTGHRATRC